jgi:hypothetical protein
LTRAGSWVYVALTPNYYNQVARKLSPSPHSQ